jgi:hypothetical protein
VIEPGAELAVRGADGDSGSVGRDDERGQSAADACEYDDERSGDGVGDLALVTVQDPAIAVVFGARRHGSQRQVRRCAGF